jgi:anti-anti-sigma factor
MSQSSGFDIRFAGPDGPTGSPGAGQVVVAVAGELDVASSPELERELLAVLNGGVSEVVVDASGLGFVDASGIGALVRAAEAARRSGGRLVLRRPSEAAQRVLDLLHLDGSLPVEGGSPPS